MIPAGVGRRGSYGGEGPPRDLTTCAGSMVIADKYFPIRRAVERPVARSKSKRKAHSAPFTQPY